MRPATWIRAYGPLAGAGGPRPAPGPDAPPCLGVPGGGPGRAAPARPSGPFARVAVDPAHPLSPSGQERPLCARGGGDMGHEGEGATS